MGQDSGNGFMQFRLADRFAQIGLNTEFHAAGHIAPALSRGEQNDRET